MNGASDKKVNNPGDERFGYASHWEIDSGGYIHVFAGSGKLAMNPHSDCIGTVRQLAQREFSGALLSATCVAEIVDQHQRTALIMLRRSDDAEFEPGALQFPAGRCGPDELPEDTAVREFSEEVLIILPEDTEEAQKGLPVELEIPLYKSYFHSAIKKDIKSFHYSAFSYIEQYNTLEFALHCKIVVPDLEQIIILSKEDFHTAELHTLEELQTSKINQLTQASQAFLKKLFPSASI